MDEIMSLIGSYVRLISDGKKYLVRGVHIYFSVDGIKSVRYHLSGGSKLYYKQEEIEVIE